MSDKKIFYPLKGVQMIEAAAGTGKTFNIQNIVLRLLLEYPLECTREAITIDRILVVTFTKAATAELRDRIRKILRFALNEVNNLDYPERDSEHERIKELLDHAQEVIAEFGGKNTTEENIKAAIKKRIQEALSEFDSNLILSIHGFCQRVLKENSFRSDILFDTEILENTDDILNDITMDFLRREFYVEHIHGTIQLNIHLKEFLGITPLFFKEYIDKKNNHPNLVVVSEFINGRERCEIVKNIMEQLEESCRKFYPEIFADWKGIIGTIVKKSDRDIALDVLANGSIVEKLKVLKKYSSESLELEVPDGQIPIELHSKESQFRIANDKLQYFIREYKETLILDCVNYVIEEFEKRKARDNFQTFSDFITRVSSRLRDPQTGELSKLSKYLREKIKVAIVDEFQDTDLLQYDIFHTLFSDQCLFMVGDPRQAIYGFRGGDIAAYNYAKKNFKNSSGRTPFELNKNFRSSAKLIEAVNEIFHDHVLPFGCNKDEISLPEIESGNNNPECTIQGKPLAPMHVTYMDSNNDVIKLCAQEIRRILDQNTQIKVPLSKDGSANRNLLPGDIAVLCSKNADCNEVKAALAEYKIPAVVDRGNNVFGSEAAKELAIVLWGIANPTRREDVIRTMSTKLIGCEITTLADNKLAMNQESTEDNCADDVVSSVQVQFQQLRQIWQENSFVEMFQQLIDWDWSSMFSDNENIGKRSARANLLKQNNGERYLTDLLQLRELIGNECQKKNLSVSGVLAFLEKQRSNSQENKNETYETMLETDRDSVVVMTIHHSKGLEFPFVFLPTLYMWKAKDSGTYHDENGQLIYDLNPDTKKKKLILDESLQEGLRLAYVGVTRAKYYCHIYWSNTIKNTPKIKSSVNPIDWLFRMHDDQQEFVRGEVAQTLIRSMCDGKKFVEKWLTNPAEEIIKPYQQLKTEMTPNQELDFSRKIDYSWKITSFSGLVSNRTSSGKDYDDLDDEGSSKDKRGIFEIPSNSKTGNAWHEIFEKIDFSNSEISKKFIAEILSKYRVLHNRNQDKNDDFVRLTIQMIKSVVKAELPEVEKGFSLSMLNRAQRLSELEFRYGFHQKFGSWELKMLLNDFVKEKFHTESWSLPKNLISGFLKGFIDLIFYYQGKFFIVDWKSNFMGGNIKNFNPSCIEKEMTNHLYFIQYLIYSIALIKFIKLKLNSSDFTQQDYDKYFGGVYYLFIRGISPEKPGQGIWFDRPDFELLKMLEEKIG